MPEARGGVPEACRIASARIGTVARFPWNFRACAPMPCPPFGTFSGLRSGCGRPPTLLGCRTCDVPAPPGALVDNGSRSRVSPPVSGRREPSSSVSLRHLRQPVPRRPTPAPSRRNRGRRSRFSARSTRSTQASSARSRRTTSRTSSSRRSSATCSGTASSCGLRGPTSVTRSRRSRGVSSQSTSRASRRRLWRSCSAPAASTTSSAGSRRSTGSPFRARAWSARSLPSERRSGGRRRLSTGRRWRRRRSSPSARPRRRRSSRSWRSAGRSSRRSATRSPSSRRRSARGRLASPPSSGRASSPRTRPRIPAAERTRSAWLRRRPKGRPSPRPVATAASWESRCSTSASRTCTAARAPAGSTAPAS